MRRFVLAICLLLCSQAHAQHSVDGGLLGLEEAALKDLLPALVRLTRPVVGPHGVRGTWRLAQTPLADLLLDTTFFVKNRRVVRIEQHGALAQPRCPMPRPGSALMDTLQARYGAGLVASDSQGLAQQSVTWVAQGVDVLLHLSPMPTQCELLLVFQPHLEKDAAAL